MVATGDRLFDVGVRDDRGIDGRIEDLPLARGAGKVDGDACGRGRVSNLSCHHA
jgi:hypothetical protein